MTGPREDPYDLVGVAELAEVLGIGRQRADVLTRSKGFPAPKVERDRVRLWHRDDVTEWLNTNRRGWGSWPA